MRDLVRDAKYQAPSVILPHGYRMTRIPRKKINCDKNNLALTFAL